MCIPRLSEVVCVFIVLFILWELPKTGPSLDRHFFLPVKIWNKILVVKQNEEASLRGQQRAVHLSERFRACPVP